MYATGLNDWGQLGMPSATGHSLVIFQSPLMDFMNIFFKFESYVHCQLCDPNSFIYQQISVLAFFYNFCFVPRNKAPIVQELVEVEGLPNNTRFIHIAAGDYHSAAVSGSHFS